MISLTETAAQRIRAMREEMATDGQSLRIFVEKGGCSGFEYGMSFDQANEGDERIEASGVSIIIDRQFVPQLQGVKIDFDDGLNGKGFSIENPNAESTCGCGRSFCC